MLNATSPYLVRIQDFTGEGGGGNLSEIPKYPIPKSESLQSWSTILSQGVIYFYLHIFYYLILFLF